MPTDRKYRPYESLSVQQIIDRAMSSPRPEVMFADEDLSITLEYDPNETTQAMHHFVMRERLTKLIMSYRTDAMARGSIEQAYGDALERVEKLTWQLDICLKALRVASAIIKMCAFRDQNASKFFRLWHHLEDIGNRSGVNCEHAIDRIYWAACRLIPEDMSSRAVWNRLRKKVTPRIFERDGYCCVYCGSQWRLSVDHVIPVSRGGGHKDENLVTCCRSCNSSKSDKTPQEWRGR